MYSDFESDYIVQTPIFISTYVLKEWLLSGTWLFGPMKLVLFFLI